MEDWKKDLKSFFEVQKIDREFKQEKDETTSRVEKFYASTVRPCLKQLKKELERYGRQVKIAVSSNFAAIDVSHQDRLELNYQSKMRGINPYPEMYYQDRNGNGIWSEGVFRRGIQKYTIHDLTREVIIENFLREYKARLWVLYKK
jgi:hypothetical protein